MLFLVVLAVIPILYMVYLSFYTNTITDPTFVGFENYVWLIASPDFWSSLVNGVVFAVGSIIIHLTVGLTLAIGLNKRFKGVSIVRTLAIFPYMVTIVLVALLWQWTAGPAVGIFQHWAVGLGLIDQPQALLGDSALAMPLLIIIGSWKFIAFAVIILLARLQAIDQSMYEQAKICGANSIQTFWTITLPHLRSAIFLVVLLRFIWLFNHFALIWILTRGGPGGQTQTLPVYIYQLSFFRFDLGTAAAASILLFVILMVGAMIYFKVFEPSREVEV